MSQDRIEKTIVLQATRSHVWRAFANATAFGAWFGAKLDGGPFVPGSSVSGAITYPGYEHMTLTMVESGFDRIPADRRETAFRSNEGGWSEQMKNIERFLAGPQSIGHYCSNRYPSP